MLLKFRVTHPPLKESGVIADSNPASIPVELVRLIAIQPIELVGFAATGALPIGSLLSKAREIPALDKEPAS